MAVDLVTARNRFLLPPSEKLVFESRPDISPSFRIPKEAKVFSIGSCTSRQLEIWLKRFGVCIPSLVIDSPPRECLVPQGTIGYWNKRTPACIWQEVDIASKVYNRDGVVAESDYKNLCYPLSDDSVTDMQIMCSSPVSRGRFLERRRQLYSITKSVFSSALVIVSVGLAEVWFDAGTGTYLCGPTPATVEACSVMAEVMLASQCKARLKQVVQLVRASNSQAKFIFMVSPTPVLRTITDWGGVVATGHSKAVLRAACGELAEEFDGVDYFPLYETVVGQQGISEVTGHVQGSIMERVTGRLVEAYFE